MITLIKNLYQYRELLKTNIKKEIRGKYKGAWLGVLWSFLNPLLMLAVYAFIFPLIMGRDIPNYPIFLMVALLPWNFFTTTIAASSFSVVSNGNILKKVYFPREIIPISVVASSVVNFLISCLIMVLFLLGSGVGITWHVVVFPLILLIETILLLGCALFLSSATVYVRDLEHIVNVILMAMFYATPVVYSLDMLPVQYQSILMLNPMTLIINAYRDVLFYHQLPNFAHLGIVAIVAVLIFAIGLFTFKKLEKNFAEEF